MAVTAVAAPRSAGRAALVALRPRQWTKNLLLFAGLLFAGKIGETSLWLDACVAFVAYCAASSASYLANDVRDAPHDREHPVKRLRPIATGELPTRLAIALAVVLACAAFGLAAYLGPWSIAFMAGFLALQTAYSAGLKHVVLIDVLVIAALFVVRASAGAEAVDVHISPWLLICTGLLALFLALAKRRAELVLVGAGAWPGGAGRSPRAAPPRRPGARCWRVTRWRWSTSWSPWSPPPPSSPTRCTRSAPATRRR
jgi:4-hydroxybenzoate polyprenyltransferase